MCLRNSRNKMSETPLCVMRKNKCIMQKEQNFLKKLGVYGFDKFEPVILAALVSEDPILLIGKAGTGKTFLLNSISEALALAHRHYNASLISFDDLIGFPFPSDDNKQVNFIPTPATIWGAESVLIDELSRCKPETQNKFFSIVHEKKIQGINLEKLKYRWAAMNPFNFSGDESDDHYEGSQPLDPALADRFAFIIEVPDWQDLTTEEKELVIYPAGDGKVSKDNGGLLLFLQKVRNVFVQKTEHPLPEVVLYCRLVSSLLCEAGLRISPRRARLLARNITALICVENENRKVLSEKQRNKIYKLALRWSLPHRAWKDQVPDHLIESAHAEAIRLIFSCNSKELWLNDFLITPSLADKLSKLINDKTDMDTRSLAMFQFLNREAKSRIAAFAFASFPLIYAQKIINGEALNELAVIANAIMVVDGKMEWRESYWAPKDTVHPLWSECQNCLSQIKNEKRQQRARQLFLYLITNNHDILDPSLLEEEFHTLFIRAAELKDADELKSK